MVWHSSLTKGEQLDTERVPKVDLRIILKDQYTSYSDELELTGIETLEARRGQLSLNFAKKCVKNSLSSDMFPINGADVNTKKNEKFHFCNISAPQHPIFKILGGKHKN